MKKQFKLATLVLIGATLFSVTSCKKHKDEPVIKEGIEKAELILTEVSGEGVEAHGDHFHGLTNAVEGEQITIKFNENGIAYSNAHLHLEADAIYKVELKAWDYTGKEVQEIYIANKAIADQYKAFLIGGNFILNANSTNETGAIFQPRELKYGDGTDVTGSGGIGTTGIISYFTVGHDNEGSTKEVTYVLRKLKSGIKETITRNDWNHDDYASKFAGEDVLKLSFEIHAEEGHNH